MRLHIAWEVVQPQREEVGKDGILTRQGIGFRSHVSSFFDHLSECFLLLQ